ncbi:hypothetical protein Tco_1302294 [Tanacetum coccineum]
MKLATSRLVNGSSCDESDMVIKYLDLEPKIDAMMRDFLNFQSTVKVKVATSLRNPNSVGFGIPDQNSWTALARSAAVRTGRLLGGGFAFSIVKSGIVNENYEQTHKEKIDYEKANVLELKFSLERIQGNRLGRLDHGLTEF